MTLTAHIGASVFDGERLHGNGILLEKGGRFAGVVTQIPLGARRRQWPGGILMPGFVDLQVNGGGGVMFNDAPDPAALRVIANAHHSLGTRAFLPTLITDTPERTRSAIAAVEQACKAGVPGIAGLHLEGPHLGVARKGAHDPDLIRPMQAADLEMLCDAVRRTGTLMVTLAPEAVTTAQIAALRDAGVVVSLGHSDCSYDSACDAFDVGAVAVTHLFNAMSGPASRAPGLAGAAIARNVWAGLIADAIHVHPATMAMALRAKPGRVFLVSDAMATAASGITGFRLNGRQVTRREGRLTLEDGTLAGADLTMGQAIRVVVERVGMPLARALAMATSIPADLMQMGPGVGRFAMENVLNAIHLTADGETTPLDA